MNTTGLLHLRASVYDVNDHGTTVPMLPLIERIVRAGRPSYGSRVDVVVDGAEALAFVAEHREELKAGVSLWVDLEGVHARDNLMHAYLRKPPTIAPRYVPPAASPVSPSQAAPA